MNKKVSIIVPVYNAERYLEKLFNSLINQTYKNLEIVLLNDGSKDNSLKLLKQFQKKYPKIVKVYTHPNMGVGKTRNKGIKVCTGEYITFVDADDYIDSDFISTLMSQIGDNDIIVSGYKMIKTNGDISLTVRLDEKSEHAKFKITAVLTKIFKKSFLIKNNISFTTLKISEDVVFTMICYSKTNKVCCSSYVGYYYQENLNSATHNTNLVRNTDFLEFMSMISDKINENKQFITKDARGIQCYYIEHLTVYYMMKAKYLPYEELQKFYDESMLWYKKQLEINNWKNKFIWQKEERFHVNAAINLLILSYKLHIGKLATMIVSKVFYKEKASCK